MTFSSVCSGIEAPSVAWEPLGWKALWFSEIEPFCSALLKARYPGGDFTKIQDAVRPDVLIGGTPCQSFSVAGKRAGLDDPRGVLALEYLKLAKRIGVRWLVWENVEGVLSHDGGRTFEAFLGAMAQCGYGFAYRVLDAQYDGLAQRRKRVFVVGYLGDWRPPAAVLFERESLRRDTSPSREKGEEVAGTIGGRAGEGGQRNGLDNHGAYVSMALNSHGGSGRSDGESETFVVAPLISHNHYGDQDARESQLVVGATYESSAVRRLTPLEWERLQGFPDFYTLIDYRGKPAKDGPRYKAIGNSISIPTLRWIGERIGKVDAILSALAKE